MNGRLIPELKQKLAKDRNFAVIGKIKIGDRGGNNNAPQSLDYFRATGTYADLFDKAIGKTNKLQIVFPSNNASEVCKETLQFRDKSGNLVCEGDGENWKIWDYNKEKYVNTKDSLENIMKDFGTPTYVLKLTFIILQLKTIFGVWELETKGRESSIPNILNVFDVVVEKAGIHFTNIPFELIVTKHTTNSPYKFKRKYPVLQLICNLSNENLNLVSEKQDKLNRVLTSENLKLLEA